GPLAPLQPDRASLDESHALDPAGEARHGLAGEDLPGRGDTAETRGQVQRSSPVAAFNRDRLSGGQADPDPERKRRFRVGPLPEPSLELDCGAQRLTGG